MKSEKEIQEEELQRKAANEAFLIDKRNKERERRVLDHDDLKKSSRAYQPGGAFWRYEQSL